jgi:protein-L-isoaspartate(D-aspartate) O-methyltransferase
VSRGQGPAFLATFALLVVLPLPASGATAAQLAERLQGRGIHNARVLDAIRRVRREAFLSASQRGHAYDDAALDIGHGQVTSQPFQLAVMLDQLGLKGKERVLEIGTGSGYDAAVLAALAHDVYSVEIVSELAVAARLALAREGCLNAHVKQGDGQLGWREYGPYDAILVTGAGPAVPPALVEQLKEGGVLVMPIDRGGRQILLRGVKQGAKLRGREVAEMKQVPALVLRTPPREPAPARVAPSRPVEPPPDEAPSGAPRLAPPPPPAGVEERRPAPPGPDVRRPVPPPPETDVRRRAPDEDEDELEPESAPHDLDDDDDRPHAGRSGSGRPAVERPDEAPLPRERPAPPDLNEEDLPERDDPGPRSDTRPRRDGRTQAARAPGARDSDRRHAAAAPASAGAGSPRGDRRSAA